MTKHHILSHKRSHRGIIFSTGTAQAQQDSQIHPILEKSWLRESIWVILTYLALSLIYDFTYT